MKKSLTLIIANKNYSSWSLRPWLAMTELSIPFFERQLKFESRDWEQLIGTLSPTGLVPVLWEGDPGTGFAVFDSLAILERLHELYPNAGVWPSDSEARAAARCLTADFHAGYHALRAAMPMNIRSCHPGKGMNSEVADEIGRLAAHWRKARRQFGGGDAFLFGGFSAADAFFAPVASRFRTYGVTLDRESRDYQRALLDLPGMQAWSAAALEETEFVAVDEPYA